MFEPALHECNFILDQKRKFRVKLSWNLRRTQTFRDRENTEALHIPLTNLPSLDQKILIILINNTQWPYCI